MWCRWHGRDTPPRAQVLALKGGPFGDDVCQRKKVAEALLLMCRVQPVTYDGQFYNDVEIIEGDAAAQEYQQALDGATDDEAEVEIEDVDGCTIEVSAVYRQTNDCWHPCVSACTLAV